MKNRKIAMEDLKVTSFVTEGKIKGGDEDKRKYEVFPSIVSECTNYLIICC